MKVQVHFTDTEGKAHAIELEEQETKDLVFLPFLIAKRYTPKLPGVKKVTRIEPRPVASPGRKENRT